MTMVADEEDVERAADSADAPPVEPPAQNPDDPEGRIPDWRTLPPVPIARAAAVEKGAVPESIRRLVLDPTVLDDHPPFTLTAFGSNQSLDAYSTRMMDSSLKNYAADAADGRALCDSHRAREFPIGKTHDGRFKDGRTGGAIGKRAEMDAYILSNSQGGHPARDTNAIIDHIRGGVYSDVSIGFAGGSMNCSICGNEMMDSFFAWLFYDDEQRDDVCMHIAGVEYAKKDKDGKPTKEREVAVGEIENAHLLELSIVYEGATPGAAIVKARSLAEFGLLEPAQARQLEAIYRRERVQFPRVQRIHAITRGAPRSGAQADAAAADESSGTTTDREEEALMTGTNGTTPPTPATQTQPAPDPLEPIRALVRSVGWAPDGWDGDLQAIIRARVEQAQTDAPILADGKRYREDLVKFALEEGVRARGDRFDKAKWEPILRRASTEEVRLYLEDWGADADAFFKPGRQTADVEQRQAATATPTEPPVTLPRHVPLAAYTG